MAFTYVGTLATDRDKVRFYIQDTVESAGPKPDGKNFSDAEIDGLVTNEETWGRAVAAAFESLTAIWRTLYTFSADGGTYHRSNVADGYAAFAAQWRKKYGYSGSTVSTSALTRVDAYSDDIASNEV